MPYWGRRKRSKQDGIPSHEHIKSLDEKEMEDLIERYRKQVLKEKMLPPSKEMWLRRNLKKALPDASDSLSRALVASRKINPNHRKPLLQQLQSDDAADGWDEAGF